MGLYGNIATVLWVACSFILPSVTWNVHCTRLVRDSHTTVEQFSAWGLEQILLFIIKGCDIYIPGLSIPTEHPQNS